MLRYWEHTALHQVYVSPARLRWHTSHWKTPASLASSPFVARQAPDLGRPGQECGVVPVQRAAFEQFYQEISQEEARALDPHLVEYLAGLARQYAERSLKALRSQIQGLYLIVGVNDASGVTFEVYGDPAPWLPLEEKTLLPLTEMLTQSQVFPMRPVDGRALVLVPRALHDGKVKRAARILALALAARWQGEQAEADLVCTLDW